MRRNHRNKSNYMNPDQVKNIFIAGAVIMLTLSSCNTLFNRDHSLDTESYMKLGMPDPKKVWTNDDYVAANITLSSLKMNDPLSLPRKNSIKSGEVFKRMVNEENLAFIYDTVFPLRTKAYAIQYYPRFQSEMEQMYTIEYKGKIYYSEELLDLNIFGLLIQDKMLELAGIINRSGDEDAESIKSGMDAVKYNYLKLIPRLLDELSKQDNYSAEGCERLSRAISESVLRNKEWMTDNNKNFLLPGFNKAVGDTKSAGIRSNLQDCIVGLKK
jgi:hypothetical protein